MSSNHKKAVCLQHVSFEEPGAYTNVLAARGYRIENRLVPETGLPLNAGDFLLVMGGPMSANDKDPWIQEETEFIREAVSTGIPVLGICLGSQLLARAFGGSVFRGPAKEVGITRIRSSEEGRADQVFNVFPPDFEAIGWHGEGIGLPKGTVTLAASDLYAVQAFRLGARAYGLLFHLEFTANRLKEICGECAEDLEASGQTAEAILEKATPHLSRLHGWAGQLIERLTT